MHWHDHTQGQGNEPVDISNTRLLMTILLNIGITIAEIIGGLMTGYLALLADAMHNLSDVAALALAWLGVKGSKMPPTKRSTYGYKRVEVMTAFISAVSLVVIAIFIIFEAYKRFIDPQPIVNPALFLVIATIGLFGNIFSVFLLQTEKKKSINMKAAFLHMFYDAVSSVLVIIGGIVIILTGWVQIDVILSVVIAVMIFWSSYLVIKETVLVFLEAVPPGIDFDKVHAAISALQNVRNVHDLHIWSLSSREIALSCHVSLAEEHFQDGPELISDINKMLSERFDICHGTIQLEKDTCQRPDLLCSNEQSDSVKS